METISKMRAHVFPATVSENCILNKSLQACIPKII